MWILSFTSAAALVLCGGQWNSTIQIVRAQASASAAPLSLYERGSGERVRDVDGQARLTTSGGRAISTTFSAQAQMPSKVYGIDFSPYLNGQDPNLGSQISANQILTRMQIMSPYANWVRSFGSTNGLENIPSIGRQLGLHVAGNAWISRDATQNQLEINNLIVAANSGLLDIAIVGSEALLRNDVTESQLIAYINQVRQAIPASIPVTTADVWGTFILHPNLIAASDVVFVNLYPYWEGTSINNAVCSLQGEYQQVVNVSGSKLVVISETGWPSAGNAVGAAVPSVANANIFALQFFTWAKANQIPSFYFEAFDETWKASSEKPQEAHWGIWDTSGDIKAGMDAFFNGQTALVNCNGQIPGPTAVEFVYVPPYGSSDSLEVQVTGVQPAGYALATFIKVSGNWWTKPTQAQPTVAINPDGSARIRIDTGGIDQFATEIAVFLIPSNVSPPVVLGGSLPALPDAVASLQVTRTQASISGTIMDSQNNPIAGAVISDAILGQAVSAPDGKYSFYKINTSETAVLSVGYFNYVFPTSPTTVSVSTGNQIVNFTGVPVASLSISKTHNGSFKQGQQGANYQLTVSNAPGAAPTNGVVIVTETVPAGLGLVSMVGNGWTCPGPVANSCTRNDALNGGAGYPPINVSVNVANNATSPQVNMVSVSGGGSANSSAADPTIIIANIPGDFNGYGVPDLVWQDDSTTQVTVHYYGGLGGAVLQGWNWLNLNGAPGWHVVAIADFNRDGHPDLVWQNDSTRQVVLHYYGGPGGATYLGWNWLNQTGAAGWHVAGAADFNGDGYPDLVWQNDTTRAVTVHYYGGNGGATFQSWNWLNQASVAGWSVVAIADFNRDGVPDLVWQNDATSSTVVHYYGGSGGATLQGWDWLNQAGAVGWHVKVAADFNGDGHPDLVWQNDATRQVTVHYYSGAGGAVDQSWNWLQHDPAVGWSVAP
jgi:exo-beta-1,3-glucanase (GH17 family)